MTQPLHVALVTEDELSMAVMTRLLTHSGRNFSVAFPIIERGVGNIKRSVPKYRTASRAVPHIILADLDQAECAPALIHAWGATTLPRSMLLRIAVRETEAWLLADNQGFAAFTAIEPKKVPSNPETLADPKQSLLNLVRRSRNRRLATELLPAQGSRVSIGPLYNERLTSFVRSHWDVEAACLASPSLHRLLQRLHQFMA